LASTILSYSDTTNHLATALSLKKVFQASIVCIPYFSTIALMIDDLPDPAGHETDIFKAIL
jgi:hypothetical protein